jgi:hypothetical protein
MQRTVINTLAAAILAGLAATSFAAADAELELQPKRSGFGWFKQPIDATSYVTQSPSADTTRQDYRFLTDYSPN